MTCEGEPVDCFRDQTIKARKQHACDACGEAILPGMQYQLESYVMDGEWHRTKRCARCETIYRHLQQRIRDAGEAGWQTTADRLDCGMTYQDAWDEEPPEHIARLAFALPGDEEVTL